MITAINPDGTVEWVDAELVPAEENHSCVQELPRAPHVSKLADDVKIRAPYGCAPELTFNRSGEISEIQGRYHP